MTLRDLVRAEARDREAADRARRFATRFGVFAWTPSNRYPPEEAVRVFGIEAAAQRHADRLNTLPDALARAPRGYVVRSFVLEARA